MATINLDPKGFLEVQLDNAQVEAIGQGCGVQTSEILKALGKDNEEREMQMEDAKKKSLEEEVDWDERFQLDPEDELDLDDINEGEFEDLDLTEDLMLAGEV